MSGDQELPAVAHCLNALSGLQVYVDGQRRALVDFTDSSKTVQLGSFSDATLDILVENMGRVNYAEFRSPVLNMQRKGTRHTTNRTPTSLNHHVVSVGATWVRIILAQNYLERYGLMSTVVN